MSMLISNSPSWREFYQGPDNSRICFVTAALQKFQRSSFALRRNRSKMAKRMTRLVEKKGDSVSLADSTGEKPVSIRIAYIGGGSRGWAHALIKDQSQWEYQIIKLVNTARRLLNIS